MLYQPVPDSVTKWRNYYYLVLTYGMLYAIIVPLGINGTEEKRIFPSEMVILMAIAGTRDFGKELLTRPMDVTGQYISCLYDSLVRRGYIKGNNSKGYQLTSEGREVLFEFLRRNKTRVKDTVRMLQKLGIEISQEVDKLEKEAIEVE